MRTRLELKRRMQLDNASWQPDMPCVPVEHGPQRRLTAWANSMTGDQQ